MNLIKYFVVILSLFILTGCVSTHEINATDYKNIMENNGYTVTDYTDHLEFSTSSYIGTKNDIYSYFVSLDSEVLASNLFNEEVNNANNLYKDSTVNKKSGNQFDFYEASNADNYTLISRIKNTYLVFKGNAKDKDEIIKLVKRLKYYNK